MRVVVAPDKLKGSVSAREAADAIARGVLSVVPEADVVTIPVADGGEGTARTLAETTGGRMLTVAARDALGRPVEAAYSMLGDGETAVVEMAAASGLMLIDREERRPLDASTEGTGDLIRAALDEGARTIVVGIGGSATTDGGTGMARALGVRFTDGQGRDLAPGGGQLAGLAHVDISGLDPRLEGVDVLVASDVDNPLTGPDGAAYVYGPQKGADPDMVDELDRALAHYAGVLDRELGKDVAERPGAGAAGGLGAGLMVFLSARLRLGIDVVLDLLDFDAALEGADLVITGEGHMDAGTVRGKGPAGVSARAALRGVPVVGLAGRISEGAEALHSSGMTAYFALPDGPMTFDEAQRRTTDRLAAVAAEVVRFEQAVRVRARRETDAV